MAKTHYDLDRKRFIHHSTGEPWPLWSSKQGLIEAQQIPVPIGKAHLHMMYGKGRWQWQLRRIHMPGVCGTLRCVIVEINSLGSCP